MRREFELNQSTLRSLIIDAIERAHRWRQLTSFAASISESDSQSAHAHLSNICVSEE
jgi:hypothetical protein